MNPSVDDNLEYSYTVSDFQDLYERLIWLDTHTEIIPSDYQLAELKRIHDQIKWRIVKIRERAWDQRPRFLQN